MSRITRQLRHSDQREVGPDAIGEPSLVTRFQTQSIGVRRVRLVATCARVEARALLVLAALR